VLAAGGRKEGLNRLEGQGASLLRERVLAGGVPPVRRRMAHVVRHLVKTADRTAKDLGPPEAIPATNLTARARHSVPRWTPGSPAAD
jgi:hypothetical protein